MLQEFDYNQHGTGVTAQQRNDQNVVTLQPYKRNPDNRKNRDNPQTAISTIFADLIDAGTRFCSAAQTQ